jgi:cell division septum initiation protein DivIVA
MSQQPPPALSKGLFGYRRSSVEQMLADRDEMLSQVETRARASEAKVADLEGHLAELESSNEALLHQIEDLRSQAGSAAAATGAEEHETSELTTKFLSEELASILAAAEESASRIIERARGATQQQIADADRMWRDAQGQIARFATWRDRVDPIIRGTQSRIDEVRGRIEEVPDAIRQALAPLADVIATLDGDLSEVTAAGTPPLLVTPSGLEAKPAVSFDPPFTGGPWTHDEDAPPPPPPPSPPEGSEEAGTGSEW